MEQAQAQHDDDDLQPGHVVGPDGKNRLFFAGEDGRTVRNVAMKRIGVVTNANCPSNGLQLDDFLYYPNASVVTTIYADRLPQYLALVRGPDDIACESEARRANDRNLFHVDTRAALGRSSWDDESEFKRWSEAPASELQAACESAPPGSPLAAALKYTLATRSSSFAACFFSLFGSERRVLKPFDSVTVLKELPPKKRPLAEFAASVAGASKQTDGSTHEFLREFMAAQAERDAKQNAMIARLLETVTAGTRPAKEK